MDSPQRAAWLAGRDAGEQAAPLILAGQPVTLANGGPGHGVSAELRAAWLNGFGYGIHEAAGWVPGHHLASVWQFETRTLRTELSED